MVLQETQNALYIQEGKRVAHFLTKEVVTLGDHLYILINPQDFFKQLSLDVTGFTFLISILEAN